MIFELFDLISIAIATFCLGMIAGNKYLPRPIDTKKEELIDRLFRDNMRLRLEAEDPKETKDLVEDIINPNKGRFS